MGADIPTAEWEPSRAVFDQRFINGYCDEVFRKDYEWCLKRMRLLCCCHSGIFTLATTDLSAEEWASCKQRLKLEVEAFSPLGSDTWSNYIMLHPAVCAELFFKRRGLCLYFDLPFPCLIALSCAVSFHIAITPRASFQHLFNKGSSGKPEESAKDGWVACSEVTLAIVEAVGITFSKPRMIERLWKVVGDKWPSCLPLYDLMIALLFL